MASIRTPWFLLGRAWFWGCLYSTAAVLLLFIAEGMPPVTWIVLPIIIAGALLPLSFLTMTGLRIVRNVVVQRPWFHPHSAKAVIILAAAGGTIGALISLLFLAMGIAQSHLPLPAVCALGGAVSGAMIGRLDRGLDW